LSLALGLVRRDPSTSLARMQREVERLNTLIAQLLMLSRLESLSQPPMQILDLAAVIAEVSSDADFEAASMDRSVRVLESASCMVRGEPDLIRSAVENVVRNALKYTDDGTQVSIRLVHVDDSRTADILVDDHGPGVPPEALDHMFEPFYRVDEARDRRSGGAGLGLAIARHIVALHSGAIQASNRSGGGLQVRITLPISSTDKS
jgi:two-component system sensor histidine kinase CpxA